MAENKTYRLGDLIELCDERNTEGKYNSFYGINIEKEFMPTAADTNGLDESKYKIIRKNRFVFSGMQTGRDSCIRIAMYEKENPILVSPAYTTFEISKKEIILPEYFFMIFQSKEMDRYGAFCSDGSIRSNLDLERFCDFQLVLPPLPAQQKAVAVYNALKANLAAYEQGLDDLKLVCDGFIEDLRERGRKNNAKVKIIRIGDYITPVSESNSGYKYLRVQGVESTGSFMDTKANMTDVDISKYTVVRRNYFAYNPSRINLGSIAIYTSEEPCIVSPMYQVFYIHEKSILPEYLMMWFGRKEFQRSTLFYAMGSVRDAFDFSLMCDVKIPLPSLEVQQNIVNMYKSYTERRRIAAELKAKIKTICPILIKGSLENM